MNFLSFLFGGKKTTKKKSLPVDSGNKSASKVKSPSSNGAATPAPRSAPVNRDRAGSSRNKQEIQTIENMNGVPGYFSVMSSPHGDLAFTAVEMQDYIILRKKDGKDGIAIIRSTDKMNSGVDHSYMTIRERVKAKGLKIEDEYVSSREIIRLIYDKQSEGRLEVKNKSAIINKIDLVLKDALNNTISDVHLEVRRDNAKVKFRKHGDLYLRHDWPVQYARDVAVVIYQVMAEEKDVMFNPSIPQDAVLDRMLDGKRLRVRIGTIPAAPDGYDIVMRLLPYDESEVQVKIADLGYLEEQQLDIEMGLSKPTGVIVIAGVTGSGKTTSLAAMIREIVEEADGTIKVITVENPPEQFMKNVTQSPVVTRNGSGGGTGDTPYANAMKAALRCDPDILMVGEVRDTATAKLLISAVQSGHKVLTTIHAPSGIGIVGRMRSLGVPNDVLGGGDFFSALVYQTLVKTICQECSFTLTEYQAEHSGDIKFEKLLKRLIMTVEDLEDANIRFVNHKGCDHPKCHNGITGRTVIAEVILPDHQMINYFANGQDMLAWKHFRASGGKSALMVGLEKMKTGILDPHDVEKALGLMNAEIVMNDGIFNYQEERLYTGSPQELPHKTVSVVEDPAIQDSFMIMDEPNEVLATSSDLNPDVISEHKIASSVSPQFHSELLSEHIKSAEVIQLKARHDPSVDVDFDPSSEE